MKTPPTIFIGTLLAFSLWGVSLNASASEGATSQQEDPIPAATAGLDNPPVARESAQPITGSITPQQEEKLPAANTDTVDSSTAEKSPDPITGAFGITLGERFEASMVARVLSEQEQTYRGQDGMELKGTLHRVEPSDPDTHFQHYSVKTTDEGIIYAIQGDYQFEVDVARGKQAGKVKKSRVIRKRCKDVVKKLAGELESHYGKPRGKGWDGEWFAFRQVSDTSNKSLRLYAHRCRTGMYSVIYTDERWIKDSR